MIVYSLKQKKETEELHLFKATMGENKECTPEQKSICKKMNLSESVKKIFSCKSETDARNECAKLGRKVCGICISDLYATYK